MNDMKKDRLKFRTIGAYMSVVYVLIGLLTVAAIFCAWMIGFDSLLILLFAVLSIICPFSFPFLPLLYAKSGKYQ